MSKQLTLPIPLQYSLPHEDIIPCTLQQSLPHENVQTLKKEDEEHLGYSESSLRSYRGDGRFQIGSSKVTKRR